MPKEYKYKYLMEKFGITEPCPSLDCKEANIPAFHYGFAKVDDNNNFIPRHIKIPPRENDKKGKPNCIGCGLSMFKSTKGARDKWDELEDMQKIKMKYTHLLVGDLKSDLGVMSIEKGEHFTFFEYKDIELKNTFIVFGEL